MCLQNKAKIMCNVPKGALSNFKCAVLGPPSKSLTRVPKFSYPHPGI